MKKILVAPSILSADFAKLGEDVTAITAAGADMIHIDVMDGNFVPNITIGPDVIRAIRPYSNLTFDVHLMVSEPEQFIKTFVEAGADIITVHLEAVLHVDRLIHYIRSHNVKVGISILPSTPPSMLEYLLQNIDLILVMTVNPGFGGQQFIGNQLAKIKIIQHMVQECQNEIIIAVDGGVNDKNIKSIALAGADMVIAGSFIFSKRDELHKKIELLQNPYNII